ncbi:GTPase IMAP family member 2 [Amia ocellicauda]|uniref:GTPase IMAP family member 2 n=1 Tax=Amia ocellicauda TaxID=2972642 RepID=UPI0034638AA3
MASVSSAPEMGEVGQAASHEAQRLPELRIMLLGKRWTGKCVAGNIILGRETFQTKITTGECVKKQGEVAGRQVTVVNTPDWREHDSVQETPEQVKQEIVCSVTLCPPGPHALLLVIPVGSVSERERRSVQEHLELLSERVWRHTIVLFTWGERLGDTTIEQHIERGGEELQWLVEKCGNRYHVLNNRNRGDGTQVTELLDKIEEMMAENRGDVFLTEKREGETEGEMKIVGEMPMIYEPVEEIEEINIPVRRRRNSITAPPFMSGGAAAEGSPGETAAQPEASSSEEKTVERPGAP